MTSTPASSTTTLVTNNVVAKTGSSNEVTSKWLLCLSTTFPLSDWIQTKLGARLSLDQGNEDSKMKDKPTSAAVESSDLASDVGFAKVAREQGWASATKYKPSFG